MNGDGVTMQEDGVKPEKDRVVIQENNENLVSETKITIEGEQEPKKLRAGQSFIRITSLLNQKRI